MSKISKQLPDNISQEEDTESTSRIKKIKSIIENSDDSDLTKQFKRLLNLYLANLTKITNNNIPELEVRFGTKKIKSISRINFYNVIKSIISNNFKLESENYYLKIITDNELSNIRTQINGLPNIQHYCKFDNIINIEDEKNLEFINKDYFINNDKKIYPVDFDEFNFRISFQVEKNYNKSDSQIQDIISKWTSTKKIFRYIKRFEYRHPTLPFLLHFSIVKTSKSHNGKFIPEFNIKESNVFNSLEHYEIEIELNNHIIDSTSKYSLGEELYNDLKKTIKYILIGLQESNFPVAISEQNNILSNYLKLIKGKDYLADKKYTSKDFIGPSSLTLQLENLLDESHINNTNKYIPNIRTNYTVTDKADGMRKLLYINSDGKLYFVTSLLTIEFTGCFTENKELFNTIVDGEHILHNIKNEYINTFAVFDIYFINSKNVTGLPFIKDKDKDKDSSRLVILNSMINTININLRSILPTANPPLEIKIKKFYANNIFQGSAKILSDIEKGLYNYNTDGLIFTPANTGVASNKIGIVAPNYKTTWNESFKWKPPEFNTIDFLVKYEKNDMGSVNIKNIYNTGTNTTSNNEVYNYLTLILHVGFDEKKHGYINPCNDIINDYISTSKEYSSDNYKPGRFYPTNPSDETAYICNIMGKIDESNNIKIYTEDGDEIEDNTIIEFKYDHSKETNWKWIPIRVRYDKTSELRAGLKNFGNAYHVANSNWHSIHNPVTEKIIKSGSNIKIDNADDDVYYNKVDTYSETRCLRDFHNLYVKNILIEKISQKGNTLIDYACGKGGDLPKWINAELEFIFGIDLSKDNIENRLNGACARYLNYNKKYKNMPKALFINGNSSINIKSGDAAITEKNKRIIKAIFGEGTKNEATLGKGVYKNYGIASNGFNISSIQFAIHYMFENETILNSFINNVAECTALNGYFIGTCYDGNKVFNKLESINMNESLTLFKNDKKIWEITKKYTNNEFNDDNTCFGYGIDIYQESINKTFREYLVNFKYLTRILENYGFVLLDNDELKKIGLYSSIGNFNQLYELLSEDVKKNKSLLNKIGKSLDISEEEKEISFLNNYFVFKKVRNVNKDKEDIKESEKTLNNSKEELKELLELDEDVYAVEKDSMLHESKIEIKKYEKEKSEKEKKSQSDKEKSEKEKKLKIKMDIDEKIKKMKSKSKK